GDCYPVCHAGKCVLITVLCNNPEMTSIPNNIPTETLKLVIEKTPIRRVSTQAFSSLSSLEYLWLSCNSISNFNGQSLQDMVTLRELRLDGNALSSFPWEALSYIPQLRLLDLHGNRLRSFPIQAIAHIRNITYLDLSSNRLTTISSETILTWLIFSNALSPTGLQDNPWQCDCRLSELVHFSKIYNPSVAFIDSRLVCSGPENLSGSLFSDTKLRKCQSPVVHTFKAKMITTVGSTVSLRCETKGNPIPELSWSRQNGGQLNGTVIQDDSDQELRWSTLSLASSSYEDSGKYVCSARNLVGSSNASVSLLVIDSVSTSVPMTSSVPKQIKARKMKIQRAAVRNRKLMDSSGIIAPKVNSLPNELMEDRRSIDDPNNMTSNPISTQQEPERIVRSVRVIGDTYHTVTLAWRSPKATNITTFSILYAIFGEKDMRRINVGPGKTKITIDGLMPQTKYIACVCVKGLIPKKKQCVIFSTDEAANASGTQKLINVVVITVACVIAVPLTLIVCCGALKRRFRKFLMKAQKEEYQNDSYVTFESLASGPKPNGTEVEEYLARHNESNRLLSPRSSSDSEETTKSEPQQNEYFC
uniref:Leucine-rich repeat, immunoglobulin-like and transmembrane domains 1b n=1 Tax=Callorhinchus milii TaxID=7868 RepID=A0A4W3HBF8_CALMI